MKENKPRVGLISQARMTSTRLPGKVLREIAGKSLLQYHVERLKASGFPVLIATTANASDNPIVDFARMQALAVHRGDEMNVLSRFAEAAERADFDVIVRVTSDCPLIDGALIKDSVEAYFQANDPWLYLSNCIERTYPRGFDFEIFSRTMLVEAFEKASSPAEKEHVTPYFYQNKHGKTHFQHVKRSPDMSAYRLTVDEEDDFKLMEKLIVEYQCDKKSQSEICDLLVKNPSLALINQHVEQKKIIN